MRYGTLQLGQPGNPKCPDTFNADSLLLCPGCSRLLLQISTQAVIVQLGIMPNGKSLSIGQVVWQDEEPFLPMIASLGRSFDAVRVRNYTAGAEAQVLASVQ